MVPILSREPYGSQGCLKTVGTGFVPHRGAQRILSWSIFTNAKGYVT